MQRIKRKLVKLQLLIARKFHLKTYMKVYNHYLREAGVHVRGRVKFIHPSVHIDMGYANNIHLGDNCVISVNSIILAHDYSLECGMTALGLGNLNNEKKIVRDIHIGNNVFIGAGCTILPGTVIGDHCIIGAGVVCTGTIPDNSVVVGAKHRIICKTTEWTHKHIPTDLSDWQ